MNRIAAVQRNAWRILISVLATVPILTWAEQYTVTVKVTVIAPTPCVINDNRPIEVEFGEVMTTRVDGRDYKKMPVNYTLTCTNPPSNALKLQVRGNGAGFDSKVLRTNKPELGIQLLQGDNKLAINDWLKFSYQNKPELWAVPVKQSGANLTGGEFWAGATMAINYQ
ncbi:exotoxin (plasmid) [Serratia marcescens]|uniref:fimbrial protein n=1 Tax=Serratia marcescens TaxID=615 RepID=UPI0006ED41D9|nr:fimbrial protein [Serratia marcescens]ALL40505.1 exotoxin [Serratia marcescens]